jgi:hypothetical protein
MPRSHLDKGCLAVSKAGNIGSGWVLDEDLRTQSCSIAPPRARQDENDNVLQNLVILWHF